MIMYLILTPLILVNLGRVVQVGTRKTCVQWKAKRAQGKQPKKHKIVYPAWLRPDMELVERADQITAKALERL